MHHRERGGGKLPDISNRAFVGRKGGRGWTSERSVPIFIIVSRKAGKAAQNIRAASLCYVTKMCLFGNFGNYLEGKLYRNLLVESEVCGMSAKLLYGVCERNDLAVDSVTGLFKGLGDLCCAN